MPLREKNGKWEYRFKLNGERVSKLTDLAANDGNRAKAERLEKQHRDSILKGLEPARRAPKRGFVEASEEFMDAVRVEHSGKPNTIRRIQTSLASLRVWFGSRHVSAIRIPDVERYKVWRLTGDVNLDIAPVRPITVRHDLDTLSKFFRWAVKMELCSGNPVLGVDKPSSEDAVRMHIITPAEEMNYFHRCEQAGYRNLADVARLMLEQGMRPDEVMTLERRGVDLERGRITIFVGKTKAARRTLKLTGASRLIIERRMKLEGSKWVFPSPKKLGMPIQRLLGTHNHLGMDFVLYDFRHTAATRWAERGMPLTTLAAILGHSSLRMVTKYIHPTQDHMDSEMLRVSQAHDGPTDTANRPTKEQLSAKTEFGVIQ
jgi:integrase